MRIKEEKANDRTVSLILELPIKEVDKSNLFLREGRAYTKFFYLLQNNDTLFNNEFLNENRPTLLNINYSPHRVNYNCGKRIGVFCGFYKDENLDYSKICEQYKTIRTDQYMEKDIACFRIDKEYEDLIKAIQTDYILNGSEYKVVIVMGEEIYQYNIEKEVFNLNCTDPANTNSVTTDIYGDTVDVIMFTILRNGKYLNEQDLKEIQESIKEEDKKNQESTTGLVSAEPLPAKENNMFDDLALLFQDTPLTWHQYFMSIAVISSMRSKDPKRQVGAVIVDDNNRVLSIGYNGFPNHCKDNDFPWNDTSEGSTDEDKVNIKDFYVVHAELNAILNYKGESLKDSTIYTTLVPCNECIKAIIQAGIKKIIYKDYKESYKNIASQRMIKAAGIEMISYDSLKEKERTVLFKI